MKTFTLTLEELTTWGITITDETLEISPTLAAKALSVFYLLFGLVFLVAAGLSVGVKFIGWSIFYLYGSVVGAVIGYRSISTRLIADVRSLRIRNHWHTYEVKWSDIVSITTEARRQPWGRLPYSSLGSFPHRFTCCIIRTGNGNITVDALTSLGASTMGGGGSSPSEAKTKAFTHWRQTFISEV